MCQIRELPPAETVKITKALLCPALLSIIPGAGTGPPGPLTTQGCIRAGVTLLAQCLGSSEHPLHIQGLEGAGSIRWFLKLTGHLAGPTPAPAAPPSHTAPSQGRLLPSACHSHWGFN